MSTEENDVPMNAPDSEGPYMDEFALDDASDASSASSASSASDESISISSSYHEDVGGHNEVPLMEEMEVTSFGVGDTYIVLMDSKKWQDPFLARIIEIDTPHNVILMEDEDNVTLSFKFEGSEIVMKTDDYEVMDMIRVIPHEPLPDTDIDLVNEVELESEVSGEKNYSDLAIKVDLLSSLIRSYNIYDQPLRIAGAQEMTETFLEMIHDTESSSDGSTSFPKWLVPVVEGDLKGYHTNAILSTELAEEGQSLSDIRSYRDYVNNSIRHSRPIETMTGHGLMTDEYSGIFLRDCLQDDTCVGPSSEGTYSYDERMNMKPIMADGEVVLSSNPLRIIGLLEEPLNKHVYSVDPGTLSSFSLFEKYLYDHSNKQSNIEKRERVSESLIVSSEDNQERREESKFLLHSVASDAALSDINNYRNKCLYELTDILLSDDTIQGKIFNYTDIAKILFKYDLSYSDMPLLDRKKINKQITSNIKGYKKECLIASRKTVDDDSFMPEKIALTDERRVTLSHNLIFSMSKRHERNNYLQKFIDLFLRSSDTHNESNDFLYNKFTNEKMLCKHYLYEVNVTNDNDMFNTIKSKFGMPPSDGYISCRVCGAYLCREDAAGDGYEDGKPAQNRELVQDDALTTDIENLFKNKSEACSIIRSISSSVGVTLTDIDIYEILLSYELLDHNIIADVRYGMEYVTTTDSHPRIRSEISRIKSQEKSEKDKSKKKVLKSQRESVVATFQKWIKDTNKILLLTSLTGLYIQTGIPSYFNDNRSLDLLDMDTMAIRQSALNYLSVKIRRLCEKYPGEKIWANCLQLFNEREYDTNEIETQLGLVTKYCTEPNFPRVISRITLLEEYIESEKHRYVREEWPTFKPLKNNILVKNITSKLKEQDKRNESSFRKVYGGHTVENNTLLRPITQSYSEPISSVLEIPEIEIFKNSSFKNLFRYAVSLYGKHPSNVIITLTCRRLIETCDKKDEILRIFTKSGWNESSESFRKLDFQKIRRNIIPDILSLYGAKHTEINSCYTNERACNDFIHNAINTYDLPLLNTKPKRVAIYRPPLIYPELAYGRLLELERYDENGNKLQNIIDRIFGIYKYDEMGSICKEYSDSFYLQFYGKSAILDGNHVSPNKFKKIEKTEENLHMILEKMRNDNSLPKQDHISVKREYSTEDYDNIGSLSKLDHRFHKYLIMHDNPIIDPERGQLRLRLIDLFEYIATVEETPASSNKLDLDLRSVFSDLITKTESDCDVVATFMAQSDDITSSQKKRFTRIFNEYNSSTKIVFKSENIASIVKLFIMDQNVKRSHLCGYLDDIQNIFSRILNMRFTAKHIPKEWSCSDYVSKQYGDFLAKDSQTVYLQLHSNVFMKTKDTYIGFNSYTGSADPDSTSSNQGDYFTLLFSNMRHMYHDLEMMKGSQDSKFNERYADIYMKYHFMGFLTGIVHYIGELKDSQSEITSDANDLFRSLESRDEDQIEEMIDILSRFFMDLVTHVLFSHYDPAWLFLNEQKLDLSNRLSKQKEREKQIIIDKLDSATREDRFVIMKKNEMGISLFYKQSADKASEYVLSDEHMSHNEEERQERLKEIYQVENVELEYGAHESSTDESGRPPQFNLQGSTVAETEGYVDYQEHDDEDEDYRDESLAQEMEQEFNE